MIIDCIFGFGFKGHLKNNTKKIVEVVNNCGKEILSVDIPSGVEASTGKIGNIAVDANATIALSSSKLGHFLPPGAFHRGKLKVEDIGIKKDKKSVNTFFIKKDDAKLLLPKRKKGVHKKSVGSVLVIGGSSEYTGAPIMSAVAALRSGAGYTTIACQESIVPILQERTTEPVIKGLPSKDGALSKDSLKNIIELAKEHSITLIGPGSSLSGESIELINQFVKTNKGNMIIDADAITAISIQRNLNLRSNIILTPHSGELSRLINKPANIIENNRLKESNGFSKKSSAIVLLKGPFSIITNGEKSYFNNSGNSGLATAGSGDILGGIIAGFCAQSNKLFESTVLGAYIHGLAADMAIKETTEYSLIATDLLSWIPRAIKEILKND